MMKFIWDAKYSVNIKSIDTQHQKFFEIINSIFFALRQHPLDNSDVKKVVDELIKYAEFHLVYEEKCFDTSGYPDALSHCQFHDLYRAKIATYSMAIQEKDADIPKIANEIAIFAQDWLSEHIMATDQRYSQFFLAHDIK